MTTKSFNDYLEIVKGFYRPPHKEDMEYSWLLFARNCWCPEIARYAENIKLGAPDNWLNEPMIKMTLGNWCNLLSTAMTGLLRTDQTKEYDLDVLNKTLNSFNLIQIKLNSLHIDTDTMRLYYNANQHHPMTDVSFYGFLYSGQIFKNSSLYFSPEMIDDERHFFTFINDKESFDDSCFNGFKCATENESLAEIFVRVFRPLFPNLFTIGMSRDQWNNIDLTAMRMDLTPAIEAMEALSDSQQTGSGTAEPGEGGKNKKSNALKYAIPIERIDNKLWGKKLMKYAYADLRKLSKREKYTDNSLLQGINRQSSGYDQYRRIALTADKIDEKYVAYRLKPQ